MVLQKLGMHLVLFLIDENGYGEHCLIKDYIIS